MIKAISSLNKPCLVIRPAGKKLPIIFFGTNSFSSLVRCSRHGRLGIVRSTLPPSRLYAVDPATNGGNCAAAAEDVSGDGDVN